MKHVKSILKTLVVTLGSAGLLFGASGVWAQDLGDGTDADEVESRTDVEAQVVGGVPTYRVGYMHSTTTSPRKAMAISITNNSDVRCDTTVRWRAGGNQLIGVSSVVIPPGQTLEHCSRTLPAATVICNVISVPQVIPPLVEGKADIHIEAACARLVNVDAKQYYMTGTDDRFLAAVYRPATILGNVYKGD